MKNLKNKIIITAILVLFNFNAFGQKNQNQYYDTLVQNVVDFILKDSNIIRFFSKKCNYDTSRCLAPFYELEVDMMVSFFVEDLTNEVLEGKNKELKLGDGITEFILLKKKCQDSLYDFIRNYYKIISREHNIPVLCSQIKHSLDKVTTGETNVLCIFSIPYNNHITIGFQFNSSDEAFYCTQVLLVMLKYDNSWQIQKAFYRYFE
jgi:hypothetical protein